MGNFAFPPNPWDWVYPEDNELPLRKQLNKNERSPPFEALHDKSQEQSPTL